MVDEHPGPPGVSCTLNLMREKYRSTWCEQQSRDQEEPIGETYHKTSGSSEGLFLLSSNQKNKCLVSEISR